MSLAASVLLAILLSTTISLPQADEVPGAPGFQDQTVFSGYLKTGLDGRKLHYVYIAAQENHATAPLTVWFNGGPGCSSLIGLLQEIGPYLVGNTYRRGDSLHQNQYAWNKISNLLFLESPAIVGFSTDTDRKFPYTDSQTADDAFEALKDFLFHAATEFQTRDLFLSGESYAGKYVPDVTDRILNHNARQGEKRIHLKGILIGNGVMSFENDGLTRSQLQFLAEKDFMSLRLKEIFIKACQVDFNSPRCKLVRYEFKKARATLNVYNVFQVCEQGIQAIQLEKVMAMQEEIKAGLPSVEILEEKLMQIKECPSDDGAISYWNLFKTEFHVDHVDKKWEPCSDVVYTISDKGSMVQFFRLFSEKSVKVWLYSGDWDDQVPFPDTEKNLKKLGKLIHEKWNPWFIKEDEHAGFFYEQDNGDTFSLITIKTASHMVPQSRPMEAYQMFYNFVHNKPVNSPISWL